MNVRLCALLKSEDQPRDELGRFASGGGGEAVKEAAAALAAEAEDLFGADMETICTEPGNCAAVSEELASALRAKGLEARLITGEGAKNSAWLKNAKVKAGSEDDAHTAVRVGDKVFDLTARQFDPKAPAVRETTVEQFRAEWGEVSGSGLEAKKVELAALLLKSEDQPRDELGRFASGGGASSAAAVKSVSDLRAVSDVSLPPDDDEYEYFYHATRTPSALESIAAGGLKAGMREGRARGEGDKVYMSKDEIRDMNAGFVIVRVPKGKAEEGEDRVEAGLTYREFTVGSVPKEDVVRVVREVPTGHGNHTIREDKLAAYAAKHQGASANETEGLPKEYAAWFNLDAKKVELASLLRKGPVDDAAPRAATSPLNLRPVPTEAQRSAGNYRKPRARVAGLPFTLENPAGSLRRPEWPPLSAHYGYVRGTEGADGDHVDVLIRPGTDEGWAGTVWVVDQVGADGAFDEHKCMVGWDSQREAERDYLANYPRGWRLGPVTGMPAAEFRRWLREGDTKLPAGSWRP